MAGAIRSFSQGSGVTSSSTGTGTLPATISAGDTVVINLTNDGDNNLSFSDFFDISLVTNAKSSVSVTVNVAAFKAGGAEDGGTFTFTVASGNERFSYSCFALSGLADPDVTAPEASSNPDINNKTMDPPQETHGSGDVGDYYVFTGIGADNDQLRTIDTYPTGYVDTGTENEGNTAGVLIGWAFKSVTSNLENPSAFVLDAAERGVAFTCMMLEAAAASGSPWYFYSQQ